MTYSLGVDLGTTTSAAALRRGTRLEVCALGDLTATMPSVALERSDGSLLVGEAAAERARYDTTLVARHVTARLADHESIVLDGRPHDPARLTRALLETVIDRVRRLHGDRPHDVVLTYPLFPPSGSRSLLERVGEATVGGVMLVPHPVAAVAKLAHDVDIAVGTTVAVLDFGGGTFEATIVRRTDSGFDVVGRPGGLPDFGGAEIDDAVFARVDAELGQVLQTVPRDDAEGMAALRRLRIACRAAKEWLSSSPDTTVEVALPHMSTWVPIRRADLENDIRPWLTAAVDVVARTIAASGLAPTDVHVALLVGGSSRIPLFGELVSSRLGLPIVADPFPELTVALGAALFGADGPAPSPPPSPRAEASTEEDVGALAAWFADQAASPPGLPATGPGPGPALLWDDLPEGPPPADGSANAEWGANEWDADGDAAWDDNEWDADDGEWDADEGDDAWDTTQWEGGEWTDSGEPWGEVSETVVSPAPARRIAGPTTGETDLWGPPSRRQRRRQSDGRDDDDGPTASPSGNREAEGTNPRLLMAIIGGALAVVGIAGAALATGMGGPDDSDLTLVDPARSAVTTTTSTSTSTTSTSTTTTSTTTTTTEPEPQEEWQPPPPPPTAPPTTPSTTTTTVPPTTTTAPPTTTATTTPTTTTCPGPPGPPGPPVPPTTTTTVGGCA
ncbi:MAG: Hsp70 family protein [Acidimicrobiales bacterium]